MTITKDIRYIGVNDHAVDLFEGQYVVPKRHELQFLRRRWTKRSAVYRHRRPEHFTHRVAGQRSRTALNGRKPDYLVVQHMEPDHSANIDNFVKTYPDVDRGGQRQDVCDDGAVLRLTPMKTAASWSSDGDTLTTWARHTLTFVVRAHGALAGGHRHL